MDFSLTEEQRLWQRTVHEFAAAELQPRAQETDERGEFNWPAVRKMGPLGLLGLNIPEEYGGARVDAISAVIAIEELAWACGSTALSIAAHNGLGNHSARPVRFGGLEAHLAAARCQRAGRAGRAGADRAGR